MDAFMKAPCDNELSVAAALRAAADHLTHDRRQLTAIANELDSTP
jgi:hypothetical protein